MNTEPAATRFAERPLHELFEAQAARTPDRIAVSCAGASLSYHALNEGANRLAHRLRRMGIGREMLVALYLERSLDLVTAILGVLKTGAAYVPLDLDSPPDRLAFVLKDASAAAVVAHARLCERLPRGQHGLIAIESERPWFADEPGSNPDARAEPGGLAYIIYTSGSTGAPKGVLIEHRSVVSLLRASERIFRFGADDVWTLFHSTAFDFSVWELWGALLYGARLVVVPHQVARSAEAFRAMCVREGVTVLNQTPSAFQAFIEADRAALDPRGPLSLRYVIFGGEALATPTLRPWLAAHGDEQPRLINMYGITETTVHVTSRRVTRADLDTTVTSRSLIGTPIPGYVVRLLKPSADAGTRDETGDAATDGQPTLVADGEVGEIAVGGAGVARGYLNRASLTRERFVRDPLHADAAARLYRSGDLGRLLANGELEYLGRLDQQVKIRGFRVELGEIEAVLGCHSAVAQCAVLARNDAGDDRRLVAYWTRQASRPCATGELRAYVAARLPSYMIPAAFVEVPQMPVTVNGKLDRRALADIALERGGVSAAYEAPRDSIEARLSAIWSEVLGLGRIGVHDNFFELGGHSLLATQVVIRIRSQLGVRVPISVIFERPTIAGLASEIHGCQSHPAEVVDGGSPSVAGDARTSPMSFPQRGLWFGEQLTGHRSAYLLPEAWRLRGPLDEPALERALTMVVSRHAALRTRFDLEHGEPVQIVDEPRAVNVVRQDLRGLSEAAQEAAVERLVAEEADRPFDLGVDLMLRAQLLVLGDENHVLLLTVHHIASDAWSWEILVRELELLYKAHRRGEPLSLGVLPIDYAEFARRQRAAMTPDREGVLLRYWRRQLAGAIRLELPADGAHAGDASDRGRELAFEVPQQRLAHLQRIAVEGGATLQMILVAAYQVLLARYCGQDDIAVATFSAGRDATDVEGLIGLFVNQIVLRVDLSGRPTFRECLARVRSASLAAYDHHDLPFERLVADLQPDRRLGENPFVRVAFQFLTLNDRVPALEGLDTAVLPKPDGRARFDLEMTIRVAPAGLRGVLVYRSDVFSRQMIERFAESFRTILEHASDAPDNPIDELTPLARVDRDRQLMEWSGAGRPSADIACIHERFASQAAETPHATAVSFGARSLTYRQLNDAAGRLARRLRKIGVAPDQVIAVHLDRSAELVVSMLAVLEAGAAYMPLEPGSPVDRLGFMMRDQQVEVLVADRHVPAALSSLARHVLVIPDVLDDPERASEVVPRPPIRPSNLAYVMYTSGSTGQPKGVGVPHQAVTRLVLQTDYIHIDSSDRIAQASSASFDASTFEIWGALLNGAHLVGVERAELLSPIRLSSVIRDRGITVLFLTTALFHEVAHAAPGICAPLRCLLVGGEVLDPSAVHAVLAAGAPRHFLHVYGPTENTTFSTAFEIPEDFSERASVPIGRPIASTTCYVLDPRQALLPAGAAGELCLGGDGLATGYVGRPELTADRFVAHPFATGARVYRTGDRVRWRTDGALEFLGRGDRQIKLRGHRIELEEIESTLSRHPAVAACAVLLREDHPGDKQLVAYWVASRGGSLHLPDALREHLRRQLPDYMIPSVFVELPSLPLSINGKLDRGMLPVPDTTETGQRAALSGMPSTALEAALIEAFQTVLDRDGVDRRASFFDLGGTSLKVFSLIDQIKRRCDRDVSVADLFTHPSVAELAALLESANARPSPPSILAIRRGGAKPPLYFPPGIMGELLVYDEIVAALPDDQPIYALSQPISGQLSPSLEAMAERFCDELCAFQPDGPLSLAGYSFAGLLAYEIARQLQSRGRRVALLAILDTGPDSITPPTAMGAVIRVLRFLENLPRWIGEDLVRSFDRDTPARLARSLRKRLRGVGRSASPSEPGATHDHVEDHFDANDWTSVRYAHVENNLRALDAFRYGSYEGRLVIFRARVRPLFSDYAKDLGWSGIAADLRIVDVPGNHHTMMFAPHVHVVAAALRTALES